MFPSPFLATRSRIFFRLSHALALVASFVLLASCADGAPNRSSGTSPLSGPSETPGLLSAAESSDLTPIARQLAAVFGDPAARSHLKAGLATSQYRERKLHLQGYLAALRTSSALKSGTRTVLDSLVAASDAFGPLELYFPDQTHRSSWGGGPDFQVVGVDDEWVDPDAFPVNGSSRRTISAKVRDTRPTLVVTYAEQRFADSGISSAQCDPELNDGCGEGGGGGGTSGGGTSADTSLFMTRLKIDDSYEGWLKGSPEFEVHILGPAVGSDSLRSLQCAGEHAGGPYAFDHNDHEDDWTGNVMLFSKVQLAAFKTNHPGKAFRVFLVEDDSDACELRLDGTDAFELFQTISQQWPALEGAVDSTFNLVRVLKGGNALQKLISDVASFITTEDDIIGSALEDAVVGQYFNGSNWIIKGPGNATKGHMKLEMKP